MRDGAQKLVPTITGYFALCRASGMMTLREHIHELEELIGALEMAKEDLEQQLVAEKEG